MSEHDQKIEKGPIYGLFPHEVAFLALLGAALYVSNSGQYYPESWPVYLFGAAMLGAVGVLIWRCREEWRQLPNKWFFCVLMAAWIGLFCFLGNATLGYWDSPSVLTWMYSQYSSPGLDEGHGLLIPFVVLALYWWRRKEVLAQPPGAWWPAIMLVGFALLLHIVGFISQQQRLSAVGFLIGLYALTGLAWGWHWLKASFFPFFLMVFCVPISEYSGPLTMPLRLLVARIVEVIAHLGLSPDLVRVGTQLMDAQHTFGYEVAAACSGIHSLVALLALTTIYGFVNFKPVWKRLVMMAIALPLAILGNVVRLCFTITVAETFGQKAGKSVETDAGYITFLVAFGCAFLVARWLEKSEKKQPEPATGTSLHDPALSNKPAAS
jgi:exosortase